MSRRAGIAAKFNGVGTLDPREMFGDVVSCGGAGAKRIATDAADVAGAGIAVDGRHTEVERIQRAGVQSQACGIDLVIDIEDLRVAGPIETRIEDFVGGDIVGPSESDRKSVV